MKDPIPPILVKLASLKMQARSLIARQTIRMDLSSSRPTDFDWVEAGPEEDIELRVRHRLIGLLWHDGMQYNADFTLSNGRSTLEFSGSLPKIQAKFKEALARGFTEYRGYL